MRISYSHFCIYRTQISSSQLKSQKEGFSRSPCQDFEAYSFIQYIGSSVPRFLAPHLLGTEATYGLRTRTSLST